MKRGAAWRYLAPGLFVLALFVVTVCRDRPDPTPEDDVWSFSGPTMGTQYNVKVVADELDDDAKLAIHTTIRSVVDRVNSAMSTYDPGSEVSVFNREEVGTLAVSEPVASVVEAALEVAEASGGAFDVTVGPLVDAWGFGATGPESLPTDQEIRTLRQRVGWRKLSVDLEAGTISKAVSGLRIDLSAIAKGYAVDQVLLELNDVGYEDVMVEIGGEVRTSGKNPQQTVWQIGVERPDSIARRAGQVIALNEGALATSGDYRNFYEIDGRRISHTIDPRSGRPIEHRLASVSVVAPTCMMADAWATALNVLGPDGGLQTAEAQGLAAYFIVREEDGFRELRSSEWKRIFG